MKNMKKNHIFGTIQVHKRHQFNFVLFRKWTTKRNEVEGLKNEVDRLKKENEQLQKSQSTPKNFNFKSQK